MKPSLAPNPPSERMPARPLVSQMPARFVDSMIPERRNFEASSRLPEPQRAALELLYKLQWVPLQIGDSHLRPIEPSQDTSLIELTPFERHEVADRVALITKLAESEPHFDRSMGALVGLAVGDACGASLEFRDALDPKSRPLMGRASFTVGPPATWYVPEHERGIANMFKFDTGQFTDDASMALCLTDSLLCCGRLNAPDLRTRFYSWWYHGYNSAFRLSHSRRTDPAFNFATSVGIGGGTSKTFQALRPGEAPPAATDEDNAGNGSLMRLAPIAIFNAYDLERACADARASSATTHGALANATCAFLAYLLVRCMREFRADGGQSTRSFLASVVDGFLDERHASEDEPEHQLLCRVLRSEEPDDSLNRCWNWRCETLNVEASLRARRKAFGEGDKRADQGYFGSYCLDGLAVALHSVAMSASYDED